MKPFNFFISKRKESLKQVPFYLMTFLVPFLALTALAVFYQSGLGTVVPNALSLPLNIWSGVASCCFVYYLKHTHSFSLPQSGWQFLFSMGYGLCSFALVQESTYSILFVYAFFPILFLFYEQMIKEARYLPFVLSMTIALIVAPMTALPIVFILFVLSFFQIFLAKKATYRQLFPIAGSYFLSILLAGFRICSSLGELSGSSDGYAGFSVSYNPFLLTSRFLPGSCPAVAFFSNSGFDLYFGLFFLLLALLFFCNHGISGKKRTLYGVFTLLLLFTLEFSPLRFVLSFFTEFSNYTVSYSFVLVFWCLLLAAESFAYLTNLSLRGLFGGLLLCLSVIIFSFIGSFHNFHQISLLTICTFFVLYFVCIITMKILPARSSFLLLLLSCFIGLELFCNSVLVTNQNYIADSYSTSIQYIWNTLVPASSSPMPSETVPASLPFISEETYDDFVSVHTDLNTVSVLNQLYSVVTLETDDYLKLVDTDLPNFFEGINAMCLAVGSKSPLFVSTPHQFNFPVSDYYTVTPISEHLYNFSPNPEILDLNTLYLEYTLSNTDSEKVFTYDSYSGQLIVFQNSTSNAETFHGYLPMFPQEGITINFELLCYALDESVLSALPTLIQNYSLQQRTSVLYTLDYLGIILSCIGFLMLFVFFLNKDKEHIYGQCASILDRIEHGHIYCWFRQNIKRNKIYYISFLIPFCFFVLNMIVTNCVPFGNNSFFDSDGLSLTLPSYLDNYYNLKSNNTYLSMNGGYGANSYATNPLIQLLFFYKLLPVTAIAPLLLFFEGICLGLCGVFMIYYLTHRLHAKKAFQKDFRLLIPAMIYALNTYMLAMHGFTGWYLVLAVFPLLMLSMDYLIYQKKTLPYVLLLTYCIIFNLYLALYMCIFLVIYFFTYHYENMKDFFRNGIRFALCSVLSAGNSFFIISNTLTASSDSVYRDQDSVFPAFHFFGNFLDQWKQHMIFTSSHAVSSDEGYVSIYYGILTLFLVLLYMCSSKIKLQEKIKKLIPIIILYISFNEQVLSFLWNGLHYQSKVPNRYVFILIFILAECAYDGIQEISVTSLRKYSCISIFLLGFFSICQVFSEGNTKLAFISTLLLCSIYFVTQILFVKFKKKRYHYYFLVSMLCCEFFCNMLFTTNSYALTGIQMCGDYAHQSEYIENSLTDDTGYYRIAFPANRIFNVGQMINAGSNSLFNSFMTKHQVNLNTLYGFSGGSNAISSNYDSTPLGMSLSSSKYIFLSIWGHMPLYDLSNYKYLGMLDTYYVFENPNALSLGFYLPDKFDHLTDTITYLPDFYNTLTSLYTSDKRVMFTSGYMSYNDDATVENSFYFTDSDDQKIAYDKAAEIYTEEAYEVTSSPMKELRIHMNFNTNIDGQVYLYPSEFVSLGYAKKNSKNTLAMAFPNGTTQFRKEYNYVILHEDVLTNFCNIIKQNQLEHIQIQDNAITGTTNYKADGYTMLSLAYDPGWHAYIDGKEVEIEDPWLSCMLIKTPAGEHTLDLKFTPSGMNFSKMLTIIFWFITLCSYSLLYLAKKRRTKKRIDISPNK